MRRGSLMLLVPLTWACAEADRGFEYRSTLDVPTRGVVLHDDGETGHAGMFGTNCPFETTRGDVIGDYELPGEGEQVQDAGTSILGDGSVLLVLGQDVWTLDKDQGVYDTANVTVEGVQQSRFVTGDAIASLTVDAGRCAVQWDGGVEARVTLGLCAGSLAFDADADSGRAVVARDGTVTLVAADGTLVDADAPGDRVAWDGAGDAIYVTETGLSAVHAVEEDGSVRWTAELDGDVHAVAPAGATGMAAVVVGHPDGAGELLYLDGRSGEVAARIYTPAPADDVTVSADGGTVAMVVGSAVHFYRAAPVR